MAKLLWKVCLLTAFWYVFIKISFHILFCNIAIASKILHVICFIRSPILGSRERTWERTRRFILALRTLLKGTNALLRSYHWHGCSDKGMILYQFLVRKFIPCLHQYELVCVCYFQFENNDESLMKAFERSDNIRKSSTLDNL